jgi:diacylglycerol kinase
MFATVVVTGAGFIFHLSAGKWLALVIAIAMVWITEAVNTAIEFLVDLISPEFNPLAGHIKDIAAAAVLLSALAAIIIGCIIFIPELLYLFRG